MSELFDGTWRIDGAQSKVWDENAQAYVEDEVGDEVITMKILNDIQDYEVLYGDDPQITLGYSSRYDDSQWVPYLVRAIRHLGEGPVEDSISAFKNRIHAQEGTEARRQFEIGKAYAFVRTIYVDPRTHYRVARHPDGETAQAMMLRRMSEDGLSYVATVLDPNGVISRIRKFVRV